MAYPSWTYLEDYGALDGNALATQISNLMTQISDLSEDLIDNNQMGYVHCQSPLINAYENSTTTTAPYGNDLPGYATWTAGGNTWGIRIFRDLTGSTVNLEDPTVGAILVQFSVEVGKTDAQAPLGIAHYAFACIAVRSTTGNIYVIDISECYTDSETTNDEDLTVLGTINKPKHGTLTTTAIITSSDLPAGNRVIDYIYGGVCLKSNTAGITLDFGPANLSTEVLQCEVVNL